LWDKILLPVAVLLSLLPLVVAAVDVGRLHWSPAVPLAVSMAALMATAGAYGLVVWAMRVNAFFSSAVRIQTERRHRAITAGPYRYVRHSGYLGHVVDALAVPLTLGSLLGAIAAAPAVLAIPLRTALENRFLLRRLPGYAEYAAHTRYRLVPGQW
jgi:protein-S-isoprenylcysteine O-methyltransferase Ste14